MSSNFKYYLLSLVLIGLVIPVSADHSDNENCSEFNPLKDSFTDGDELETCEKVYLRDHSGGIELSLKNGYYPIKGMGLFCIEQISTTGCGWEYPNLEEGNNVYLNGRKKSEIMIQDRGDEIQEYGFRFKTSAISGMNILHICKKRYRNTNYCVNNTITKKAFSERGVTHPRSEIENTLIYNTPETTIKIEEGGQTKIKFVLENRGKSGTSAVKFWVGKVEQKKFCPVARPDQCQTAPWVNKSKFHITGVFKAEVEYSSKKYKTISFPTPSKWKEGMQIGVITDSMRDGSQALIEEISAKNTVEEEIQTSEDNTDQQETNLPEREPLNQDRTHEIDLDNNGIVNRADLTSFWVNKADIGNFDVRENPDLKKFDYNCDWSVDGQDRDILYLYLKNGNTIEECNYYYRDPEEADSFFNVDINSDGVVNKQDYTTLFNDAFGNKDLVKSRNNHSYDYNCDQDVLPGDATTLKQWINGEYTLEPCSYVPTERDEEDQEQNQEEINIELELGETINANVRVPDSVVEDFLVLIKGPNNKIKQTSPITDSNYWSYTFNPQETGRYNIKVYKPALVHELTPTVNSALKTSTFVNFGQENLPKWKQYCQINGYNAEKLFQQIKCINKKIVPICFKENPDDVCITENENKVAKSLCNSLNLNYDSSRNTCVKP